MTLIGKPVTRTIPPSALGMYGERRALIVTVTQAGIEFRAFGRHSRQFMTWEDVVRRFDDLRKDLR